MHLDKSKAGNQGSQPLKGSWADTMKNALARKQPAAGWPAQAKPRDSGIKKVKKDAF